MMVMLDAHNHLDNDSKRETFQTDDVLVKRLDKYGFDMSVIMPNPLDTITRIQEPNNSILEAIKKHPKRFIGFCCVNPLFKDKAVKEIERCFNLGFKGIGEIVADAWQISVDDKSIVSLIHSLDEFDVPILIHSSDTKYSRPKAVENVISKFPERAMIVGHMGTWNRLVDDAISIAKRYKKVYLDTANVESPEMIKKALDEVGPEKILFGSDSFHDEEFQRELNKIEVLNLTNKEKKMIMGENLARILKLSL